MGDTMTILSLLQAPVHSSVTLVPYEILACFGSITFVVGLLAVIGGIVFLVHRDYEIAPRARKQKKEKWDV